MDANSDRDSKRKGLILKLGLGLSPLPVVGEVALSWGFYDLLKESGFGFLGIPAALLTRFGMYESLYVPLYRMLYDVVKEM